MSTARDLLGSDVRAPRIHPAAADALMTLARDLDFYAARLSAIAGTDPLFTLWRGAYAQGFRAAAHHARRAAQHDGNCLDKPAVRL